MNVKIHPFRELRDRILAAMGVSGRQREHLDQADDDGFSWHRFEATQEQLDSYVLENTTTRTYSIEYGFCQKTIVENPIDDVGPTKIIGTGVDAHGKPLLDYANELPTGSLSSKTLRRKKEARFSHFDVSVRAACKHTYVLAVPVYSVLIRYE